MAERTDHSEDIARLRRSATKWAFKAGQTESRDLMLQALAQQAAAALLEVHDATGISLDNWVGPRGLVEFLIEHPIQENQA